MIFGILRRQKKLFLIFLLIFAVAAVYSQSSGSSTGSGIGGKFRQRLEWNADKNAFEYKVEIRQNSKIVQTITTTDNYINLNLPSGSYEYRVSVYDFLGRVQDVSAWQKFVISKASIPSFEKVENSLVVDITSDSKIVLPLEVENVAAGTTVTLVNVSTGEKIAGSLVLSGALAGKSEVGKASAEFSKIPEGEWKLIVENPSGLKAESPVIAIKLIDTTPVIEEPEPVVEPEPVEVVVAPEPEPEPIPEPEPELLQIAEITEPAAEIAEATETSEDLEDLENTEASEESEEAAEDEPAAPRKALGLEIKIGGAVELSLFDEDLLSHKNFEAILNTAGLEKINFAPYAAISLVPDFGWFINPGIEISTHAFTYSFKSSSYHDEWDYRQNFQFLNVQASLVGQIRVHPQKFFINLKAGGGIENILVKTEYMRLRNKAERGFMYPKINAGLSMEFVPAKHFVIEIGADYNKIVSSKVNVSYVLPYLAIGVRF